MVELVRGAEVHGGLSEGLREVSGRLGQPADTKKSTSLNGLIGRKEEGLSRELVVGHQHLQHVRGQQAVYNGPVATLSKSDSQSDTVPVHSPVAIDAIVEVPHEHKTVGVLH